MRRTTRYVLLIATVLSLGLPGVAEAEHPPPQRTGHTWTAGTVTVSTTPAVYEHENSWRCDGRTRQLPQEMGGGTLLTGCDAHSGSGYSLPAAARNSDGTFSPARETTRCPGVQECGHNSGNSGWTYTGDRNVKVRDAITTYTCASGGSTTTVTQAESAHCGTWTADPSTPDPPTVTPPPTTEPPPPTTEPPAPLPVCLAGWHNHAAGTGHGQACQARHSVPFCTFTASGVWTPGHALGEPGHARVSGLRVCPQPAESFCADSGHNVWIVTIERQWRNSWTDGNPSWLLHAGYHPYRIPSGGNLGHSQFLPSLIINNIRSPDTADLKIGEWAPAWAIAPRAPTSGRVTAVDWDWDRSRFRSCGTMVERHPSPSFCWPGVSAFEDLLIRTIRFARAPMSPLARCAGESDLLFRMFQMDSKKSQKISENVGIKLVIVSPMV